MAGAALAGAAVIHVAQAPVHFSEWPWAGLFFGVLAAAQLAVAIGLVSRRRWHRWGIAVNAAALLIWAVSRSIGMPVGPIAGPESIGIADAAAVALEAIGIAALLLPATTLRPISRTAAAMLVAVSLALSGVGVAAGAGCADEPVAVTQPQRRSAVELLNRAHDHGSGLSFGSQHDASAHGHADAQRCHGHATPSG